MFQTFGSISKSSTETNGHNHTLKTVLIEIEGKKVFRNVMASV